MYLLDGLKRKRHDIKSSFHVPGHKFGNGIKAELGEDLWQLDFTEIPGTDNLHHPEGIIQKSQERLAAVYGSEAAYFLVNGSTVGNLAMVMSAVLPGQKILVVRDAHKSIYNALILSHAMPILIEPEMSPDGQVALGISCESIEKALLEHPDAVAVVLTYPNYYGHCSAIKKIVDIVHKYDRILLVDGAHSAHFVLHDGFPTCAVKAGADVVVQSTHKTLLALTQSSVLHVQGNRVDRDRLSYYLAALQTSSPSYVLMSSLDATMAWIEREGKEKSEELIAQCHSFLQDLNDMGLQTYEDGVGMDSTFVKDLSRINLSPKGLTHSGYELDRVLRERYGIQCEFSAHNAVVCVATVGNSSEDFKRLKAALMEIRGEGVFSPVHSKAGFKTLPLNSTPAQAIHQKRCWQELEKSAGEVSADFITPYPPGIPMVLPGMILNAETVELIRNYCRNGHEVTGITKVGDSLMVQTIERKSQL